MIERFRHVDSDQTIVFGDGAIDAAADLIGDGFTLLTTPRAAAAAPAVAARAARVVEVPHGQVDVVAAKVRSQVASGRVVALGGGRVVDVAKAIAAAEELPAPVAIPTSLSGAEMTGVHRHARGVAESTPRVRAAVVVNDPALSASQPFDGLAASSANALAHATAAVLSTRSTPIARAVGLDAVAALAKGWPAGGHAPVREALALGALLAGWAVDRSGLGPHHALTQTAVRLDAAGHGPGNAALLPHTLRAFAARQPAAVAAIDERVSGSIAEFAEQLWHHAGEPALTPFADDAALLARAVEIASGRPELKRIPPPLDADAIQAIYAAAAGGG